MDAHSPPKALAGRRDRGGEGVTPQLGISVIVTRWREGDSKS